MKCLFVTVIITCLPLFAICQTSDYPDLKWQDLMRKRTSNDAKAKAQKSGVSERSKEEIALKKLLNQEPEAPAYAVSASEKLDVMENELSNEERNFQNQKRFLEQEITRIQNSEKHDKALRLEKLRAKLEELNISSSTKTN